MEGPLSAPDGHQPECVLSGLLQITSKPLHWPQRSHWFSDAMIKELDSVLLTTDLPNIAWPRGISAPWCPLNEGGRLTVEFMTLTGDTVAVVTLLADPYVRRQKTNRSRASRDGCLSSPALSFFSPPRFTSSRFRRNDFLPPYPAMPLMSSRVFIPSCRPRARLAPLCPR